MDQKTKQLMEQMKGNPAMLQAMMQSRDGQALLQILTQQDQGASLQRAAQAAVKGNPAELMQMVNQVMKSPGGAELIERINKATRQS